MRSYSPLNEIQFSAISEMGNIGAGNAATALSHILADKVLMSVPQMQFIDVNYITTILGGPENQVAGILVNMTEDVEGMLLFLLEKEFVCLLVNVLMNENIEQFDDVGEMEMSAIMELGNILAGAYVSAISVMTGLNIRLSPPQIAVDMLGAILSYPAAQFGSMGDEMLFIEEDFLSGETQIKSHLLIMPEAKSLETIFDRLGVC